MIYFYTYLPAIYLGPGSIFLFWASKMGNDETTRSGRVPKKSLKRKELDESEAIRPRLTAKKSKANLRVDTTDDESDTGVPPPSLSLCSIGDDGGHAESVEDVIDVDAVRVNEEEKSDDESSDAELGESVVHGVAWHGARGVRHNAAPI